MYMVDSSAAGIYRFARMASAGAYGAAGYQNRDADQSCHSYKTLSFKEVDEYSYNRSLDPEQGGIIYER